MISRFRLRQVKRVLLVALPTVWGILLALVLLLWASSDRWWWWWMGLLLGNFICMILWVGGEL